MNRLHQPRVVIEKWLSPMLWPLSFMFNIPYICFPSTGMTDFSRILKHNLYYIHGESLASSYCGYCVCHMWHSCCTLLRNGWFYFFWFKETHFLFQFSLFHPPHIGLPSTGKFDRLELHVIKINIHRRPKRAAATRCSSNCWTTRISNIEDYGSHTTNWQSIIDYI